MPKIKAKTSLIGGQGLDYRSRSGTERPVSAALSIVRSNNGSVYSRLSILKATDRLISHHGGPDAALVRLNWALRRCRTTGLRAAFWESVQISLVRRSWARKDRVRS